MCIRDREQDDAVATWSEGTITKLKQVLAKVLVENEYLDDIRADHLNPVYLHPILENAIRSLSLIHICQSLLEVIVALRWNFPLIVSGMTLILP